MTAVQLDPAPSAGQIKSRQRVRDLAEVYTHEREVNAMLDLIPDMFPADSDATSRGNHDRTFLEPACGSGNFLEAILRRKLATVTSRTTRPTRAPRQLPAPSRVARSTAGTSGRSRRPVGPSRLSTLRERYRKANEQAQAG